ncbi:replication initiation protein, partial [Klebsiella pneumoniae]
MITKSNTLVEAGYDLTMAEHDLMTLAINKIHKQQTGSKQVMITAKEFAAANQVSDIYAYKTLKDTAQTLGEKKLKFTLYRDLSIISDK